MQVNNKSYIYSKVSHGVPQGSVPWPVLFSIYMLPLGNFIRINSINVHCYADDTQLCLSMKSNETSQLAKLQACLKDIKIWMTTVKLWQNWSYCTWPALSNDTLTLDGIPLACSTTVRKPVVITQDMSFNFHIKQTSLTTFSHLRNIEKLCRKTSTCFYYF